jgi:hypothetical protein
MNLFIKEAVVIIVKDMQEIDILTHMPIARQLLGKHIPKAYALNIRTSIAR